MMRNCREKIWYFSRKLESFLTGQYQNADFVFKKNADFLFKKMRTVFKKMRTMFKKMRTVFKKNADHV